MFASLRLVLLLLACVTVTQCGCISLSALMGQSRSPTLDTTMLKTQGYSMPPGGMPSPVTMASDGLPRIVLEVRGGEQKHLESIPVPMDRPLFIEELVQQAKLHERFGNMNVSIMRPTESGAPPVRLETEIRDNGKASNIGSNYALLPNDHIIVVSDQRSSLEKFIDKRFKQ
jgi:hypothetical protein